MWDYASSEYSEYSEKYDNNDSSRHKHHYRNVGTNHRAERPENVTEVLYTVGGIKSNRGRSFSLPAEAGGFFSPLSR